MFTNNAHEDDSLNVSANSVSAGPCITDLISDTNSLKPRQCALMLSYLDHSNVTSILTDKNFKLNILKDCLLLGAQQTQLDIQKLPSALKKAAISNDLNFQQDFMHPLWLASTQFLFDLLQNMRPQLPTPPAITINASCKEYTNIYETKLGEFARHHDFYTYLSPVTEAINAYLKCIRQYPCLQHQLKQNEPSHLKKDENAENSSRK